MNETHQDTTPSTALAEDLKGWNWGAFLLNWIWGIGNQTWIALLTLIPVFGLIWMFVLGAKGNQWAWEKGRWHSLEQFKQAQRKWAIAGFTLWGIMIASFLSIFVFVFSMMHHSWVAQTSFSSIQQDTQLQQRLGTPITRS